MFENDKLVIIAGPCALESRDLCFSIAAELKRLEGEYPAIDFVYKGSFDKANRTAVKSPRGLGLSAGLAILAEVKERFGLRLTTDVHDCSQVAPVAELCDVLQIPAFLCRQTDLLTTAGESRRIVNVKKGQFLSPQDTQFVAEKLTVAGAQAVWLTERGTCFGYGDLIVDPRSYGIMQPFADRVVHDATHCLQGRQGAESQTNGERQFLRPLARAALAAGANAVFIETHVDPPSAISDRATQLPLSELSATVHELMMFWAFLQDLPLK